MLNGIRSDKTWFHLTRGQILVNGRTSSDLNRNKSHKDIVSKMGNKLCCFVSEEEVLQSYSHPRTMSGLKKMIENVQQKIMEEPPCHRRELELWLKIFATVEVQLDNQDKAGEDTEALRKQVKLLKHDAVVAYTAIKSEKKKNQFWLLFAFILGVAIWNLR